MVYAKNLPGWERACRILLGCAAIAWGLLAAPSILWTTGAIAVGACLLLTCLLGFCPGCAMVGRRPVRG